MEKYFALIKNNLVDSIIVADESFLTIIQSKYDAVVDVTDNRPNVGDSYYPDVNEFISNLEIINEIDPELYLEDALPNGTEDGFEPFKLSKYSVSYKDGMVQIGCKYYSAQGLLHVLHKLLIEEEQTTHCFTAADDGPAHGKFGVTWDDAQQLYDVLIKVKF